MIGQTISHYTILEKLGEGGMGVVYRARDTKLDRDVALKFLPPSLTSDSSEKERFYHEARAAAALTHPNIAVVHEIGEYEDPGARGTRLFIAMEYVQGETLKKLVGSDSLSFTKVLDIAVQILEGLSAAHEIGIVHRDIKSENIILTSKGQAKITDFGLAKVKGATKLTKTGSTLGTAAYMSPEQARGEEVDHRSDIFSFGVVLYELLTARLPFRGEHPTALMYSIVNEEPQPVARFNEKATPEVERIVAKALVKDRDERYQHADDMLADLRHERKKLEYARTGYVPAATVAAPPPTAPTTVTPSKRNFLKIGFGVLAVVTLIGLALIFNPFGFEITPKKATAAKQKTIAVLPFTNIGGGQEDGFFCDGMTEDIQTQLSKIADLSVISRNSIMRFKGSTKSTAEIGAELGAGTILQGNIRRSGTRVRIVAQLVDAASDRQIWAENYDREMMDIFDIQSDVAQAIASALRATLTPAEKVNIEKQPTANLDAYAYCVKGREYYYRYTDDDLKTAESLFKKAIALDTNYAAAYAGLSDVYVTGSTSFRLWDMDMVDTAVLLSTIAVAKDPASAEAHKALGLAYELKGWYTKAIVETRKAVDINPNYGPAMSNLGDELINSGSIIEGMRWRLRATRLDPLMAWRYAINGYWYSLLSDDENAEKQFRRAMELQPDLLTDPMWWWHADQGKYEEAFAFIEKRFRLTHDTASYYGSLRDIYLNYSGDFKKASRYHDLYLPYESPGRGVFVGALIVSGFLELHKGNRESGERDIRKAMQFWEDQAESGYEGYTVNYVMAVCNAILANKEDAYHWLDILLSKNLGSPRALAVDPWLDNLRSDQRFKTMMTEYRSKIDSLRLQVRELGNP